MAWLTGKIAAYITGGLLAVIVGLGLALFATRSTLADVKRERDTAIAQRDAEQAKHAVTRQSLDQALAEIQRRNAEAEARAKAYAEAKAKDAQTIAKLDELAKDSAHRIAILEGIRQHAETTGTCAVAPGILEQAEGL